MNTSQDVRGVKCLVQDGAGRILLVKISYAHKQWTLPGGGVDIDESYEQAAHRELREETGVIVSNMQFFGEYEGVTPVPHPVRCFYAHTDSKPSIEPNDEISEIGWFALDQLPDDRAERVDLILSTYAQTRV